MPSSAPQIDKLRATLKRQLPSQLAESHIKLAVRMPNQSGERIFFAKRHLTVGAVLDFLLERDFSGQGNEVIYRLFTAQGTALDSGEPIASLADQSLVLRSAGDRPLYLLTAANGKTFPIFKLPAIMGRYNQADPTAELTIDLTGLDDNNTVSRQHVRLSAQGETLILENISKRNYVLCTPRPGDSAPATTPEQIPPGQSRAVSVGDQLQLGSVLLTLGSPESPA